MKIAYLIGTPLPSPKASSVQVMMMCSALACLGHDVALFAPDLQAASRKSQDPRRKSQSSDLFVHYGVEPNFIVRTLPKCNGRLSPAMFQIRAVMAARLGRAGVCYARGRNYLAPLLAVSLGSRAIYEFHGLPASPREAAALRRLARSPRARFVAISHALREKISNLPFPATNLLTAPDGVDLRRFTPALAKDEARRLCGLPLDRRLVVYVGGLYAGRGLEDLTGAVGAMHSKNASPLLIMVGGRDEAEVAQFRTLAEEAGVEAMFAGYRPPAEIPRWLFAADVLAMPYAESLKTATGEDTSGWMSPLKMFEYMAAGRPIVATDLPALREVLRHESNALLAAPGQAESLRDQIQRALTDEALAERLGRQARHEVEGYTWEKRAKRILEGWR